MAYKDLLDGIDVDVEIDAADISGAVEFFASRDVAGGHGLLDSWGHRGDLEATSTTQINLVGGNLTALPIRLQYQGRKTKVTALPTAVTISGGAGTKYVYGDLGAPGADHLSALTLAMSATAPDSEATAYRIPLGEVEWDGAAIKPSTVKTYRITRIPSILGVLTALAIGTNAARSGTIRLPTSASAIWRNATDTGELLRVQGKDIQALANNGIAALAGAITSYLFVINATEDHLAIFSLQGSNNTTSEVSDVNGSFSITAGTASRTNIYWSAGNSRYELENKRGSAMTYALLSIADGDLS